MTEPRGRAARRPAPAGQHQHHGAAPRPKLSLGRWAAGEDAKLLWLLQAVVAMRSLRMRALFLALGFTAIVPLAMAYSELLPLPVGGRFILLPSAAVVVAFGFRHTDWGRRALVGYVSGFVATGIYDCLRLSLTKVGVFPGDPIPGIGRLLLNDPQASWIWGYAWRFLGNGAGMGMAYAMLPWRGVKSGIIYGTAICLGLFGVLAIWPVAQVHFFPLKVNVGLGTMAGHWVYGATLGYFCAKYMPPVRLARGAAAPAASRPLPSPAPVPVPLPHPGAVQLAPAAAQRRAQRPSQQAQRPVHPGAGAGGNGNGRPAGRGPMTGAGPVPPYGRGAGAPALATNGNGRGRGYGPSNGNGYGAGYGAGPSSNGNGYGNGNSSGNRYGAGRGGGGPYGRGIGAAAPGGGYEARPGRNGAPVPGRGYGTGAPAQRSSDPGAGLEDTAAWTADSLELVALPPGGVPPSAISGELPVVPPLRPPAGRTGREQQLPGGGGFPVPPPGSQSPASQPGRAERPAATSGRQVVPSRARRHAAKEPEPW